MVSLYWLGALSDKRGIGFMKAYEGQIVIYSFVDALLVPFCELAMAGVVGWGVVVVSKYGVGVRSSA